MSNIDNMGATVDLKILAQCIQNKNEVIKPGREQYSLLLDCGGSSSGGVFDCVTKRPRFESGSWAFFFFSFLSFLGGSYFIRFLKVMYLYLCCCCECFKNAFLTLAKQAQYTKSRLIRLCISHQAQPHTTNHRKCPPGIINCWMSRLYLLVAIC